MAFTTPLQLTLGLLAACCGLAVAGYAVTVAITWCRYGRPTSPSIDERDELLDRFMPAFDVVERHHIRVDAPAAATFTAACEQDLLDSPVVRAIFRTRELVLGAARGKQPQPNGLLRVVRSLGWGVLAELPEREVVLGAVTRPWEANVTFQAVPPGDLASYNEPGYVKIAWTLRVDPCGADQSIFRTETRAVATDAGARAKFRSYWAFASPGIATIRWLSLRPLKRAAERRSNGRVAMS